MGTQQSFAITTLKTRIIKKYLKKLKIKVFKTKVAQLSDQPNKKSTFVNNINNLENSKYAIIKTSSSKVACLAFSVHRYVSA